MTHARTSRDWWNDTKRDDARLLVWLRKQHHGESTAAERIRRYCLEALPVRDARRRILLVIADQERTHAAWIGDLLRARGEAPAATSHPDRYWSHALADLASFDDAAGAAYHAETMRLERIEAIAHDADAPADIRNTFARILHDERFHARAFRRMATDEAIARTRAAHETGAHAIGFVSAGEFSDEATP